MNNSFTARMKAFLPSLSVLCLLFLMTLGRTQAATTTFSTDSSWLVTNTVPAGSWILPTYVVTPAWVAPGGGKTTCNQVGVVGANKIWFPANTANQTNYFRKTFSITNTCELKSMTVAIAADDNYILFVNGVALATGGATAKTVNIPISILKCDNVIAVQARDFNGKCWWMSAKVTINTTTITIPASSNSPATNPICVGQTLNLSAGSLAGATYSWTGPGGFTSSLQNPVKPNVAMADTGVYTVVVSSGKCCRFVSTVQVSIKNCKECLDLVAKEVFCKNGIYYMNVCIKNNSSHVANFINLISTTPGVTYSPNILNPPGGLLPGQTYCKTVIISGTGAISGATVCLKATLLEIKNCVPTWSCTSMDELCVKLPDCGQPPVPCQWSAAVKDSVLTICKGASTVLSAYTIPVVAGATYAWTSSPASTIVNGSTATPTVTPSANPTTYTVTIAVINSDGTVCMKTATVKVFLKDCPPVIPCDSVKVGFVPNTITICLGDSVQLNPITNPVTGLTYMWLPPTGLSNASIKNPFAKPSVTTTYNLIVGVPSTNCKKDASVTITVTQCSPNPNGQRKASEEAEIEDIKIAPNPTQSVISVQIPDSMNWEKATLINAQGIILNEQERINEVKSVKFDVQSHPSGMYVVRVKTDKGFVSKKVIKE
jgi:Secretion system C-terminal sorting domain